MDHHHHHHHQQQQQLAEPDGSHSNSNNNSSSMFRTIHRRASNMVNTILYASQIFSLLQSQDGEESSVDGWCRQLMQNEHSFLRIGWLAVDDFSSQELELLSDAIKRNTSVRHVSVGWTLKPHSLLVLLEAISQMSRLESLSLALHADVPESILLQICDRCASLQVVDLRSVRIGTSTSTATGSTTSTSTSTGITATGTGTVGHRFSAFVAANVTHDTRDNAIILHPNATPFLAHPPPYFDSREDCNITTILPFLLRQSIPLSSSPFGQQQQPLRIQTLRLMDCDVQMDQVLEICHYLSLNNNDNNNNNGRVLLKELSLAYNKTIPPQGYQRLLRCNILRLDITGCDILPSHAHAMASALLENYNQRHQQRQYPIQELCMARNPHIGALGVAPLVKAACVSLRHLDLSYCMVDATHILQPAINTAKSTSPILRELVLQGYDQFPQNILLHFLHANITSIKTVVLNNPEQKTTVSNDTLRQVIQGLYHNYQIHHVELEWGPTNASTKYAAFNFATTTAAQTSNNNSKGQFSSIFASSDQHNLQHTFRRQQLNYYGEFDKLSTPATKRLLPYSTAHCRAHVDFYLRLNRAGRHILRTQYQHFNNTKDDHDHSIATMNSRRDTTGSVYHYYYHDHNQRITAGPMHRSFYDSRLSQQIPCSVGRNDDEYEISGNRTKVGSRSVKNSAAAVSEAHHDEGGGRQPTNSTMMRRRQPKHRQTPDFADVLGAASSDIDAMYWLVLNGSSFFQHCQQ